MTRVAAICALALLLPQDPAPGPVKLRWKVPKDHFVHYKAFTFAEKSPDALTPDNSRFAGLFGYEIADDLRCAAGTHDDYEIPLSVCLTLPAKPLAVGQSAPLSEEYRDFTFGPIQLKGSTTRRESVDVQDARCVELVHKARIVPLPGGASTGIQLKEGEFDATVHFDAQLGVVRKIRFSWLLSYRLADDPKKQEFRNDRRSVIEFVRMIPLRYAGFDADVGRAIERGVEAIRAKMSAEGNWGEMGDYKTGQTALALLAILKGSLDRKDPQILKALDWMLAQPFSKTYDTGISLMALEAFYSPEDAGVHNDKRGKGDKEKDGAKKVDRAHLAWAVKAAQWLLSKQSPEGMWSYPTEGAGAGGGDYSNTQYGVLGLLAAYRLGVQLDANVLLRTLRCYLNAQQSSGSKTELSITEQEQAAKGSPGTRANQSAEARGWSYSGQASEDSVLGSMTLGGIASVTILDSMLRQMRVNVYGQAEAKRAAAAKRDGWAWMQQHWTMKSNAGRRNSGWYPYYLYTMERAGMLNGVATVGGHDWYGEGAVLLVANQADNGTWMGGNPIYDQCFFVLFLKRATKTVPTVVTGK